MRPKMKAKLLQIALLLALLPPLAACDRVFLPDWSEGASGETEFFADAGVAEEENLGLLAKLRQLRESHAQDPADIETALAYSRGLRRIGSARRALEVMEASGALHPEDARVQEEFAKVLLSNGEHRRALEILDSLPPSRSQDWRSLSAHGVALDHAGRHKEAQEKYHRALELEAGHPAILTNLGLSHILNGEPETAEAHLRLALGDARADARTRQNLALALGLRGRLAEAEQLAARDLPPEAIQNNLAWLRSLTAEPIADVVIEDISGDAPAVTAAEGAGGEASLSPAVARLDSQQEGIFFLTASQAETLWRQRRHRQGRDAAAATGAGADNAENAENAAISGSIETAEIAETADNSDNSDSNETAPVSLPAPEFPASSAPPIPVFPILEGGASP